MTPNPTIAEGVERRIRAACAHRGITMQQLSELARQGHPDVQGLGPANIKGLGSERPARVEQLAAIAAVTGMPLWYLVAGVDGLDLEHEPQALDTVPAETLAEVQALRADVAKLSEKLDAKA